MTRLHLALEPTRRRLYTEALTALGEVEIAASGPADALVTGDLAAVRRASGPVLLDQPFRIEWQDLAALASSCLMPAHEWRFLPSVLPVHASRASGQLGEPGLLRIHHWLAADDDPSLPAVAQLDLAHWLFGALPEHTHFLSRTNYLQAHLAYPGGGMALLDVATHRPGPGDYYSLHLLGSDGAAYADDHRNAHLLFDQHGPRALLAGQNRVLAIRNMLHEFLGSVRENRPWSVCVPDTINALTTLKEAADA